MCLLRFVFSLFIVLNYISYAQATKRVSYGPVKPLNDDFVGCPYDNDFYYAGNINSPLWPANYPPNDKCYYYLTAQRGYVLAFNFTYFDLETCCDYITIYDGPTARSPILVQIGGPNMTTHQPNGTYYSTTRSALMTFVSDKQIEQTGFQMTYKSVATTTPCNRDILLVINGLPTIGSQQNFMNELNFLANNLTTSWNVGSNTVRVMINFQTDEDYAEIWASNDVPNNQKLSETILGLSDLAPDYTSTNTSNLNCLFRYAAEGIADDKREFDAREGIEQVAIILVAKDANNDQDYNEATEYAHQLRAQYDAKTIVIAMGSSVNQPQLEKLSYGKGYTFQADYSNLASLVPAINNAICGETLSNCGA